MADHHHHQGQESCSSGSSGQDERILDEQLDAAGQSLRRALKMSFSILKIIIAVLLVVFACRGIFQVQQDEKAILLHLKNAAAREHNQQNSDDPLQDRKAHLQCTP